MATISNNLVLYFLTLIKLNKLILLISLACQYFCFVAADLPESSTTAFAFEWKEQNCCKNGNVEFVF